MTVDRIQEHAMTSPGTVTQAREPLKVYWQPGCTGCLRMKEFLTRHGVEYISINVLENDEGREELVRLAGRRVPIARRGDDWADGQILADLARVAGIDWTTERALDPADLAVRATTVIAATRRFTAQIPEASLDSLLPDRPRTYRQLVAHIVQIFEAFLDLVEHGRRLEFAAYNQDVPAEVKDKAQLLDYVQGIGERFEAWWRRDGRAMRYDATAEVYYGEQTLHEFFERSTWHAAQHARQLQLVVETLGLVPDRRLTASDLSGLPLPAHVWDDELKFTKAATA
jgi:hypothetical protein